MSGEQQDYCPVDQGFSTRAIHPPQSSDQRALGAVVAPITTSATFVFQDTDQPEACNDQHYQYGRTSNPSREILEKSLASLETAKHAVCFSSGMASISATVQLLRSGDRVLAACDLFGGTRNFLSTLAGEMGVGVEFIDPIDLQGMENKITPQTKMVWVESPSNPLMNVVDLRRVAQICRARDDILLVVDNTFLTSYFQKPLDLGAHVVMYSISKYVNGHSDVVMGAVVTNREDLVKRLKFIQNTVGAVPSPFDCYLVTRGLKTLALRMRAHMEHSRHVAEFLLKHPHVETVLHPGLPSHPQHELFKSQSSGHSGMLAVRLRGAELPHVLTFVRALRLVQFAKSLGGVETLVACPALMSHVFLTPEERAQVGVTDNLIRLSVGLENPEDICKDLDQALNIALDGK